MFSHVKDQLNRLIYVLLVGIRLDEIKLVHIKTRDKV